MKRLHIMAEHGSVGDFIIGDSELIQDAYLLSIKEKEKTSHIGIIKEHEMYSIESRMKFASVNNLVEHFLKEGHEDADFNVR